MHIKGVVVHILGRVVHLIDMMVQAGLVKRLERNGGALGTTGIPLARTGGAHGRTGSALVGLMVHFE